MQTDVGNVSQLQLGAMKENKIAKIETSVP